MYISTHRSNPAKHMQMCCTNSTLRVGFLQLTLQYSNYQYDAMSVNLLNIIDLLGDDDFDP